MFYDLYDRLNQSGMNYPLDQSGFSQPKLHSPSGDKITKNDHKMDSFCLFDLILYVPSTIFQLNRDRSSWVEPVLS